MLETGEEWDHGRGWNTRPREDALEAENVRLRAALTEIASMGLGIFGRRPDSLARTALGETQ